MKHTTVLLFVLLHVCISAPVHAQVKPGDQAPDFGQPELFPTDGKTSTLWVSDFVGPDAPAKTKRKALLISFCASYCKPCWKELPFLLKLKDDFGAIGLEVWSVLADREPDGLEAGRRKLAAARGKLLMTRTGSRAMGNKYMGSQWEMPALYLIDSTGKIKMVLQGLDQGRLGKLRKVIEGMLD